MKKLVIMLLAVAAMCACGEKGTEEPKPEIKDGTYTGTLVVTQPDDATYEEKNLDVEFTANEDGTVDIVLKKVKFSKDMPLTLNEMLIPGVPATKNSGGYTLSGSNIAPKAMDMQNKELFEITSISGNVSSETITLDMNLKMNMQQAITGTFPMTYSGTAKTE